MQDDVDKELVAYLKRPKQEEDECHHFGLSIAAQMRKMDQGQRQWAMMNIQRMIYETMFPPPPPINFIPNSN